MSDTEHNKGKLIPCEWKGSLEETCKSILVSLGKNEQPNEDESYRELLEGEGYREYFVTDNAVYRADYKKLDPDVDILTAVKNDDGSIDFETRFYNGGCSFNEALEEAISKIEE